MSVGLQTRKERAESTRRLLLDITVECLVELGYAGTTGPAVAARAGLSRGAQLHHFGTRDQMVVAAVEHLAEQRLDVVHDRMAARIRGGPDDPPADEAERRGERTWDRHAARDALELLAEALSGPLYGATLELWVAARTNDILRAELVPAEERVHAELREVCRTWITSDSLLIQLTLDLLLGRGVSGMLVPHPSRWQRDIIDRWIVLIETGRSDS